jgi:hypothetical protein
VRFEVDSIYVFSIGPAEGSDRWMWGPPIESGASRQEALHVKNVADSESPTSLRVGLQGHTDDRAIDPDHHLRLSVNGEQVGEASFDGQGAYVLTATLPAGLLTEGSNAVEIASVGDTGAVVDSVFLNWVELEYLAGYRSSDDRLEFSPPSTGRHTFELEGFHGADVDVVDVTDLALPAVLTGARPVESPDGTWTVRFTDSASSGTRYIAYRPTAEVPPAQVLGNRASHLHAVENGADYVIITHAEFAQAIEPLAAHYCAKGLRVFTADIADVYDEYSHGVFDPRAIKSFLRYAFDNWERPAPTYVLLVGESNLDYRRLYNRGPHNFVPSVQLGVESGGEELAYYTSDIWFVAFEGVLPDMLLGRFSVSTAEEASAVVDKTLSYGDAPADAQWRTRTILVADDDAAAQFEGLSEILMQQMPPNYDAVQFYAARYPRDADLTGDIAAAINGGALALNFAGHGNVALWSPWPGGGRIFQTSDILRLENGDRMPIYTAATCMNGWIDHPLKPVSMTEAWVNNPAGGGAIAWGPSGFTSTDSQLLILESLYGGLYDGRGLPIGGLALEASARAYAVASSTADTIQMFILIGDPALVVSGVPVVPSATPEPEPHVHSRSYLPRVGTASMTPGPSEQSTR